MYFLVVYVCNLQNIHSLSNVVILFTIKTCQPCHYIKPITHVYTRERHENKNTRFWATYGFTNHCQLIKLASTQCFANFEDFISQEILENRYAQHTCGKPWDKN